MDCTSLTLHDGLEFVFLDGAKQLQETLALFTRLMPHLNSQCRIVSDDIHWSAEMREAWKRICHQQGLQPAIFEVAGLDLYGIRYRSNLLK
jgi:predicted O-methyltransferase YrrM